MSGLAVAMVTSLVTVRLSIQRFYTERWWERKADYYTDLVEAMEHVRRWLAMNLECARERGATLTRAYPGVTYPERDAFFGGLDRLKRAASTGDFLMSPDALAQVAGLVDVLDRPVEGTDVAGAYALWNQSAEIALREFKALALLDLNILTPRAARERVRTRYWFGHNSDEPVQIVAEPRGPTPPNGSDGAVSPPSVP
ncbi:hypothetical protein BSZ37_17020 [Rubrivirga marina]|uniref:Uncharacterized protein n=1 Tax=Rubrivirga marina TaxID=1196024 RepID=A0A271J3U2_9BACT|nr:hypothetical protein BSZ37_17020 [Rubrivirga marina]